MEDVDNHPTITTDDAFDTDNGDVSRPSSPEKHGDSDALGMTTTDNESPNATGVDTDADKPTPQGDGKVLKKKKGTTGKGKKKQSAAPPLTKEQHVAKILQERLETERKYTDLNKMKVETKWREAMRLAKFEELHSEISQLSQMYEQRIDSRKAMLSVATDELETAEQLRHETVVKHMQHIQSAIDVYREHILKLEREFEEKIDALQTQYNEEREQLLQHHHDDMDEYNRILKTMKAKYAAEDEAAKQQFNAALNEVKNHNSEDSSALRITLDAEIERMQQSFENAHATYLNNTEQKFAAFDKIKTQDIKNSRTMTAQTSKIHSLTGQISHVKSRIASSTRENTERNNALKEEKQLMYEHFQTLKQALTKFRLQQEADLKKSSLRSHTVVTSLKQKREKISSILHLAELTRHLETEEEKIMPYYESTVEHELAVSSDQDADMERFFQRYNKVLLDKVVLEKELDGLSRENEDLKKLLQQYLDGTTVRSGPGAVDNTLLIINQRTSAARHQLEYARAGSGGGARRAVRS